MPVSQPVYCVCKGKTEEGKSRCKVRITRKGKKYSAEGLAGLIPDYDYVKGDSLSKKCYERLRIEKNAILARQKEELARQKEEELARQKKDKQRMQASARKKRQRQAERERTEREQSNMKYDVTSTERPKVAQLATRDQDAKVAVAAAWFMADIDDEDSPREMTELSPAEQQRILGRFQGELNNHMRIHTCGVCGIRDFASRPLEDTYVSIDKFRGSLLLSEDEARLHQALSPLARSVRHVVELKTESGDKEFWRLVDDTQAASIAVMHSTDRELEEWAPGTEEGQTHTYVKTPDLQDRGEYVGKGGKGGWDSASSEGLCVFISTCIRCVKLASLTKAEIKKSKKLKIPTDVGRLRGVRVPEDWACFGGALLAPSSVVCCVLYICALPHDGWCWWCVVLQENRYLSYLLLSQWLSLASSFMAKW